MVCLSFSLSLVSPFWILMANVELLEDHLLFILDAESHNGEDWQGKKKERKKNLSIWQKSLFSLFLYWSSSSSSSSFLMATLWC